MKNNQPIAAILSGGKDPHYVLSLAKGLLQANTQIIVIGNKEMSDSAISIQNKIRIENFHNQNPGSIIKKIWSIFLTYCYIISFAARSTIKVFHIQWEIRFEAFDRIFMTLLYKIFRKRIIFTAHNINDKKRDGKDSFLNRVVLKVHYSLCDKIIVHTAFMKSELISEFNIRPSKVVVIPYVENAMVPECNFTKEAAREFFDIKSEDKVLLFFGNIAQYKGLDLLIDACHRLLKEGIPIKLLIGGRIKKDAEGYWCSIESKIQDFDLHDTIIKKIEFIPDKEIPLYFKAADALVLPYRYIYQSGILFMAYKYGVPVIASDVGSFSDDVVNEHSGFVYRGGADELFFCVKTFFDSNLYRNFTEASKEIIKYNREHHSVELIGHLTKKVYLEQLKVVPK